MKIYLAGAINGCSDEEANGWRNLSKELLRGHVIFDPMDRDYRGQEDSQYTVIVEGDKRHINNCDILLVYAENPSWGTAMEIMYAYENTSTYIYFVTPNLHTDNISPWVKYHVDNMFSTIEDACMYINQIWWK